MEGNEDRVNEKDAGAASLKALVEGLKNLD